MNLPFPIEPPSQRPEALWSLQTELLARAEAELGARDASKQVYQPQYGGFPVPRIINSLSGDGAWAELTALAAGSWSITLFQLAHETVHLLDPVAGNTNLFEEGVAVDFSLQMCCQIIGGNEAVLQDIGLNALYREAWDLVRGLGTKVMASGRAMRQRCGALSKVSEADLKQVFHGHDEVRLKRLCESFG
jgi:hypothetical protein